MVAPATVSEKSIWISTQWNGWEAAGSDPKLKNKNYVYIYIYIYIDIHHSILKVK